MGVIRKTVVKQYSPLIDLKKWPLLTSGPYDHVTDEFREQARKFLAETNDPEAFPGLRPDQVSRDSSWEMIAEFSKTAAAGDKEAWCFCPLCQVENKFLHGWLLLFPDGRPRCAGNCCAADWFGIVATRQRFKEFRQHRRREENLKLIATMGPLVADLLEELRAFDLTEYSMAVGWFRGEFRSDLSDLYGACVAAASSSPPELTVIKQVLDYEAMHRQSDAKKRRDVYKEVHVGIHTLRGGYVLAQSCVPKVSLQTAIKGLGEMKKQMKNGDAAKFSEDQAKKFVAKMTAIGRRAATAEAEYQALADFSDPGHLAGIVKWTRHKECPLPLAEYSVIPGGIQMVDDNGETTSATVEKGFSAPTWKSLYRYQTALAREGRA